MKIHFAYFSAPLFAGLLACASSSNDSSSNSASGATTLSCMIGILDTVPECQFYQAAGKDAAYSIAQLRSGCVDQGGVKAHPVDACPTAGTLGGCKRPVSVKGGAQVTIDVTDFRYAPGADAGALDPKTVADVKSLCASDNSTYVASP